jgi:hypothetical protein
MNNIMPNILSFSFEPSCPAVVRKDVSIIMVKLPSKNLVRTKTALKKMTKGSKLSKHHHNCVDCI